MYLPYEIRDAEVLITVKTYPQPSRKYDELVCTAGITSDGKWIRIYPVPFRALPFDEQYQKYRWIKLDLLRNTPDFRPESYKLLRGPQEVIEMGREVGTLNNWAERKQLVLTNVFDSLSDMIALAKKPEQPLSLGTLRPSEIEDLIIEPVAREWDTDEQAELVQLSLFSSETQTRGSARKPLRKLPYKYSYRFISRGDNNTHTLMIEDWEIGALFWNCMAQTEGDERAANELVRRRYVDEFLNKKDLYLFMGTTKANHWRSPSPFIIVGVFYPPKSEGQQLMLGI